MCLEVKPWADLPHLNWPLSRWKLDCGVKSHRDPKKKVVGGIYCIPKVRKCKAKNKKPLSNGQSILGILCFSIVNLISISIPIYIEDKNNMSRFICKVK